MFCVYSLCSKQISCVTGQIYDKNMLLALAISFPKAPAQYWRSWAMPFWKHEGCFNSSCLLFYPGRIIIALLILFSLKSFELKILLQGLKYFVVCSQHRQLKYFAGSYAQTQSVISYIDWWNRLSLREHQTYFMRDSLNISTTLFKAAMRLFLKLIETTNRRLCLNITEQISAFWHCQVEKINQFTTIFEAVMETEILETM